MSTAAGGTGESESRNKALVLYASMAVGPLKVAGRRSAGAGPVGRDGRERGGAGQAPFWPACSAPPRPPRFGDVFGADCHVHDVEIAWTCRANMVHVHLVSVEVSAAGRGRHKEGGRGAKE